MIDTKEFIKRKEQNLTSKYAKRSLRQVIRNNAITTDDYIKQIEKAYAEFIEMPFSTRLSGD